MTNDLSPLEVRIATMKANEDRLNRDRKSAMHEKLSHRDAEKRKEASHLSRIDAERSRQVSANAEKERVYQESIRREGEELAHASQSIRQDLEVEMRRREAAEAHIGTKVAAQEAALRKIRGQRP